MDVVVSLESRFYRARDNTVWARSGAAYPVWRRYLRVFDGVKVVARTHPVEVPESGWERVDGAGVRVTDVPNYLGPWQYLARAVDVRRAVMAAVSPTDAVIMRVPSQLAACLEKPLVRGQRPFGLEVVGDPWDVFARGAVDHPLRAFFRRWFARSLKRQCRRASGVSYVTEKALQRRYPAAAYSVGVSDVELPEEGFRERKCEWNGNGWRLVTVGTLAELYKGPDVLLEAVADCVRRGMNLTLTIAGDGRHLPALRELAGRLGIGDRVRFLGHVPAGDPVRKLLDEADLFLLPSRQEGLPRAMVEAMARGLPCIGSTVGGIPELLGEDEMVPPGDARLLADKISALLGDPERMRRLSRINWQKARAYHQDELEKRRDLFYRHIRTVTERWLAAGQEQPAVL